MFLCSGERPTAAHVAEAILENRAELVHLPSTIDLCVPLPSKECPNCDGSVRCFSWDFHFFNEMIFTSTSLFSFDL